MREIYFTVSNDISKHMLFIHMIAIVVQSCTKFIVKELGEKMRSLFITHRIGECI